MSGMTRSTPSWSSLGKASPQSMTTISSPQRTAVMFLPISPIPPSGMICKVLVEDVLVVIAVTCEKAVFVLSPLPPFPRREGGANHWIPKPLDQRSAKKRTPSGASPFLLREPLFAEQLHPASLCSGEQG